MRLSIWGASLTALGLGVTDVAVAQATSNAIVQADDAFGFTSGDEAIGIYDESSVRGFNLESAGNYRVNGTYFVKSSGVSSFFLESTTVRVGYNTLGTALPGPSGVVDFRLRDPARGESSLVTLGLNEFEQPYLDLLYKHRSSNERFSAALGAGFVFDRNDLQGGDGRSWLLGGTARVSLGAQSVLRIFGGEYDYRRDGLFRIINTGNVLPRRIARDQFRGQHWARERGQRRIAGMLFDSAPATPLSFGGTIVFSQEDPTQGFRQFFTVAGDAAQAQARIVASPQQRATAWSGELRARWTGDTGALSHHLELTLRGRRSRSLFGGDRIVDLGEVAFGEAPGALPKPDLSGDRAGLKTAVDQWGAGIVWRAAWNDRVVINTGLLKTRYVKRFAPGAGVPERGVSEPWLYNIGAAWRMGGGAELYASYSRGLEEAGIAPASAVNRNAVLDAIIVTQREIGLKYDVTAVLKAVVAAFDTRKPYAGIEASTNIYRFIGNVRHRGIEASLSGRPREGTKIVAGGVYLQPRLSGAQVDAGIIGTRPAAVPEWRLIANVDQDIRALPGLSIDMGGEYIGRQTARTRIAAPGNAQLGIPASVTIDLGARYRFQIANLPVTARAQVLNLFDSYAWVADASETLGYSPARRYRLVLTAEF